MGVVYRFGAKLRLRDLLLKMAMPGALTVGLNDDEAERRKRRLRTNIGTIMSPGCHTPKFGQSAQSSIRYGVGSQLV